jgi:hypothetical protein
MQGQTAETVLELMLELPERSRVATERMRARLDRKHERWHRELAARETAGDRRFGTWCTSTRRGRDRRDTISVSRVAALLRVDEAKVLRLTRGLPFRLDFGRSHNGQTLTIFYWVPLIEWARRRLRLVRGSKAVA